MEIILNEETLTKIDAILMEMPYKYAAPVVNIINQRIQEVRSLEQKESVTTDNT